jgi:hypothetical protein
MEFFTKNSITVITYPPYSPDLAPWDFPPFPGLKRKLKDHFDTTEVIEAELLVVLNTLTEHDFHSAYTQKETASRVMASKPKVNFWSDGSTCPGHYGYHLVH